MQAHDKILLAIAALLLLAIVVAILYKPKHDDRPWYYLWPSYID